MSVISDLRTEVHRRAVMDAIKTYRQSTPNAMNPRFHPLADLTPETISIIADGIGDECKNHIIRFLIHCTEPQPNDLTVEFLALLPTLTEEQRGHARTYFATLRRWRDGNAHCLDLMVNFSQKYLQATGAKTLPYTSEKDQQLFQFLSEAPHVAEAISYRVDRTDDITPELIAELSIIHPALIEGAL